ncbi:unnamed protein product [Schistosoma spindalis]|nr:unnamed protein product [Schistosoma spindale]
METSDGKRNRKLVDAVDERKSSGSGSYFLNSVRPVQNLCLEISSYLRFQEISFLLSRNLLFLISIHFFLFFF